MGLFESLRSLNKNSSTEEVYDALDKTLDEVYEVVGNFLDRARENSKVVEERFNSFRDLLGDSEPRKSDADALREQVAEYAEKSGYTSVAARVREGMYFDNEDVMRLARAFGIVD